MLGVDILEDGTFINEWVDFRDNKLSLLMKDILKSYPTFPFRLPVPGTKIENGKLYAINELNLSMQYRVNSDWQSFENPLDISDLSGQIELRTRFGDFGNALYSRTQKVSIELDNSANLTNFCTFLLLAIMASWLNK